MSVLALDEWTPVVALAVTLAAFITVVHRAEDVSLAVLTSLLVVNRTAWIVCLNPIVSVFEVLAVTSFVTKTPNYDRWVVLERENVVLVALEVCVVVDRVLCKSLLAVSHTVTFDVSLCCNVDTVFVAKVIPAWIVWIVTSTNGVHVEHLHDFDVLKHTLH